MKIVIDQTKSVTTRGILWYCSNTSARFEFAERCLSDYRLDRYSGQIRSGKRPIVLSAPPVHSDEEMVAIRVDQTLEVLHRQPRDHVTGRRGLGLRKRYHSKCHDYNDNTYVVYIRLMRVKGKGSEQICRQCTRRRD